MDKDLNPLALNILLKLSNIALQELLLACGLEKDVAKVEESLKDIKAVLLDAEKQRSKSSSIQEWLKRLENVLYDIQDVMDEIECEALRRKTVKSYGSIIRKVRRFFSTANSLAFRNRMGHKIQDINRRLEFIHEKKSKYSLQEKNDMHVENLPDEREMNHSYKDDTLVVGRKMEKDFMIEALLKEFTDVAVTVIAVVGMGGMGKTTLARLVYNDQRVENLKKLWVSVSGIFKFEEVMIKIINTAFQSEISKDRQPEQLRNDLHRALSGGEYLLFLDDVWEASRFEWQKLEELLKRNDMRGRIVVTTRYKKVASIMGNLTMMELNNLGKEDSWSLFSRCAFKGEQERQDPLLIDIGKQIVSKCFGVPLAVETLGCMLYSKTDAVHWKSIRDSELWKGENAIVASLRLSYNQLPSSLKKCFAYCSFFPKNYEFDSVELVYFWMAHGLLESQSENQDLENVGFQYFDKLCSEHLFHSCSKSAVSVKCKMHALIHDLAISVTQNEFLSVTQKGISSLNISDTVRHLYFPHPESLTGDLAKSFQKLAGVRTLSFSNERRVGINNLKFIRTCLSKFQHLRFLDLSDSEFSVLPKRTGRLKQLRYLSLRSNYFIKRLPDSICKLQSLEALLLGNCKNLKELPKDLKHMVSLRYLWITMTQTSLPTGAVGRLECLRYLGITDCRNLESWSEDMTGLKNLKTLVIRNCQNLVSLPKSMKFLLALETLVITDCERLQLKEETDVGVTQFSLRNLQLARLQSLKDFPQWLVRNSKSSLQVLKLLDCYNLRENGFPDWLSNKTTLDLQILGCPGLRLKYEF